MFYVVECNDGRILVVEDNPIKSDGALRGDFVDMYFGQVDIAERDIIQITGPHIEIGIESRLSVSRVHYDRLSYQAVSYDADENRWTE